MPILKLGRRAVTGLPAVTKTTIFYDSDLTGFGVKATPTGALSWVVEYRPGEGGRRVAKRRMVIGTPATLSPEKAREAAETLLAKVKLGGNDLCVRLERKELPKGTENPAVGIEPFDEQPRQRYLTDEELQRLGNAIREAETVGIPCQIHIRKRSTRQNQRTA